MDTAAFDYELPEELIAQRPLPARAGARMLVLPRESGACELRNFLDLKDYLRPGDCLVVNDTRVIPARLFGVKEPSGARIELLLLRPLVGVANGWAALLRPARRLRLGDRVRLLDRHGGETDQTATLLGRDGAEAALGFDSEVQGVLERCGHLPLPPYVRRSDEAADQERYQTIYAAAPGAVAAPTAGLHFTEPVLTELRAAGVDLVALTLHVGPGTFRPVTVADPREHRMHAEHYRLSDEAARRINRARSGGGRVIAVGTTAVRVLETCADATGQVHPGEGETEIFLYPPSRPRAVDALLTNFHLPKSTLLMLVCCFADRQRVLAAYHLAVRERFRFYSYGDCMLLC